MSTVEQTTYTPEDLLRMPDGDRYELVEGDLLEKRDMGALAIWVAGEVFALLRDYAKHHGGWAFTDGVGYQCYSFDSTRVRRPDASYVRPGRFDHDVLPEGHIRIPPDLAVEVVSPNDLYYKVEHKVDEYFQAGVSLVWVVNPAFKTVRVFRKSIQNLTQFGPGDEITDEEIMPGFRCRVIELFPPQTEKSDS
ncbi:MAG: Uma2 family endonuclease [Planctomycetaceae bacterium]